jgi:hypothetical protein
MDLHWQIPLNLLHDKQKQWKPETKIRGEVQKIYFILEFSCLLLNLIIKMLILIQKSKDNLNHFKNKVYLMKKSPS